MKKQVSLLLAAVMLLPMFSGCAKEETTEIPQYNVSVSASEGGSVSTDASKVEFGDNVVINVQENDGYVLASFLVNGNEVELEGDTYTIAGAMRDYNITATFVKTDVTVTFSGEGTADMQSKNVSYGGIYGKLPVPNAILGKRFVGWENSDGELITESSIVDGGKSTIELMATWTEVSEEEKSLLQPISISTTYNDMAATKYGVVWHTKTEPVYPVMMIQEGIELDPEKARIITADYEYWFWDEYVVNAVADELEFSTTYTAKLGDLSANVWSDTYTFTTREEELTEANFIYVTDTQETYRLENMDELERRGYTGCGYLGTTYSSQALKEATTRFPEADFIAHGGDIVNWGIEAAYWEEMLGSWAEFLFKYPMMAVSGNHEEPLWYAFGSKDNIVNKMFNVDWEEDAYASSGMFYSFDYGPMHFVALRSNDVFYGSGSVLTDGQINWMINDIRKAQQNENTKWIVAMMHEGPIVPGFRTMNSNHHSPSLGGQLLPLFDELDVDMLLYGHNHYLTSTYPLVWDENAEPQPYTDQDFPDYPNEKPLTVSAATRTTVDHMLEDGTVVQKYVYPEGTTNRGTVYHQCMCTGPQVGSGYKYNTVGETLKTYTAYRRLQSNAVGCIEVNGAPSTVPYNGYCYVEVTEDTLTVRTYGVDARSVYNETDPSKITDHAVYVDGFMLTK